MRNRILHLLFGRSMNARPIDGNTASAETNEAHGKWQNANDSFIILRLSLSFSLALKDPSRGSAIWLSAKWKILQTEKKIANYKFRQSFISFFSFRRRQTIEWIKFVSGQRHLAFNIQMIPATRARILWQSKIEKKNRQYIAKKMLKRWWEEHHNLLSEIPWTIDQFTGCEWPLNYMSRHALAFLTHSAFIEM